ncbi:hypothetical protein OCGS_1095 [Oceaniovalibus guishaninsula JLT2003]|uniref:Uncharacterized protein n=1 Tax=Oceaniovalibus guishaninsula JLT2003 TaxID=1231392 RepID=K2HDV5_9RHOB|nr:RNase adapter RapZ [Oceaniovalibus guishaninsula]EKE44712.1 hypothetical protein OCGS_1095 [Oceaniovalibus guishaninsula JLT2003]
MTDPAPARLPDTAAARLVLITGPSGAGRSTAINVLEDMGFEAIDNLPISMIGRLLQADDGAQVRPLALGIDVRNRHFSPAAMLRMMDDLAASPELQAELVYLDARPDTLRTRYSETRRRHPLAPEETPDAGIARELALLAPVRERADYLIDTSELTPHDLRAELTRRFAPDGAPGLALTIESFSYKRGLPQGADIVLDMRFLRNPHWVPALRDLDGRDPAVAAHVAQDRRYDAAFGRIVELVLSLLPAYLEEGKAHFALAIGCTGGQHRSVAVVDALAKRLASEGWRVSTRHLELERRAGMPSQYGKGSAP